MFDELAHTTYMDCARAHADSLIGLLVPGFLVSLARGPRTGTAHPSPFEDIGQMACNACNNMAMMQKVAQFWMGNALWRVIECDNSDCEHRCVQRANTSITPGESVDGNSHWDLHVSRFLPGPDTQAWADNPIINSLRPTLGGRDGEDLFHQALERIMGVNHTPWSHSRLGGAAAFIQENEEPRCDCCDKIMPLLAQLGPESGYHWADLGQMYVFTCPDHPDHSKTLRDTH